MQYFKFVKFISLPQKNNTVLYKIKLKNSEDEILLDDKVFDYLSNDPYLTKIGFLNNLRKHSSGCAVFQRTWKIGYRDYNNEIIYLHKLIAEKFLGDQKTSDKKLVGALNGNKLDCRLENLAYRTRAVASRMRNTKNKEGYTGVYRESKKYRAVISKDKKTIHLGMFDTAEEAALAYNKKSKELFGENGKQNKIKTISKNTGD